MSWGFPNSFVPLAVGFRVEKTHTLTLTLGLGDLIDSLSILLFLQPGLP